MEKKSRRASKPKRSMQNNSDPVIQFRMPIELQRRAKEEALKRNVTLSHYLNQVVARDIDTQSIWPFIRLEANHIIRVDKWGGVSTDITKILLLNENTSVYRYVNLFSLDKMKKFLSASTDPKKFWKADGEEKINIKETKPKYISICLITKDQHGKEKYVEGEYIDEELFHSGGFKIVKFDTQRVGTKIMLNIKHHLNEYAFKTSLQYKGEAETDAISFTVDIPTEIFTLDVLIETEFFAEDLKDPSVTKEVILKWFDKDVVLVRTSRASGTVLKLDRAEFKDYSLHKMNFERKLITDGNKEYFSAKLTVEKPFLGAAYRVTWICPLEPNDSTSSKQESK